MRTSFGATFSAFALALWVGIAPAEGQERGTAWEMTRDLRIGSLDSRDYALSEVPSLVVGRDGRIYVGQTQERAIRVFDRSGTFVRTIGRQGAGPGEFQSIGHMGWRSDTLWVNDPSSLRVSLLSADGRFLGSVSAQGPLLPGAGRHSTPDLMLADGTFLSFPRPNSSVSHPIMPLLRVDRRANALNTIGRVDVAGQGRMRPRGSGTFLFRIPVPLNSLYAVAPDGRSVVVVERRPLSDGPGNDFFQVQRFGLRGDTIFSRRYRYPKVAVPAAVADSARDWMAGILVRVGGYSASEAAAVARDSMPMPRFQVPVSQLVVGLDGTIWLRREGFGRDQAQWLVLSSSGEIEGYVPAPPGLRILQARRDMVWGVEVDEFEVPYVMRYRVGPRSAGRSPTRRGS
jgi:hypothetical protein